MKEFEISHEIYFNFEGLAEASEVAQSLNGLKGIVEQLPDVLKGLTPTVFISDVRVYVSEVKDGSLFERVLVKLFFFCIKWRI